MRLPRSGRPEPSSRDCKTGQASRSCPDQAAATGSVPRGRTCPSVLRGPARRGRAQGTAARVPREESSMSFKSKVLAAAATLTLVGGVGAAGALTRGNRVGGHPVVRLLLRQHVQPSSSARTSRRTSRLTCCGRARRSASRSSCSGPRTTTRRWTGPWRSRAPWRTSTRPAWCPPRSTCTTAVGPAPSSDLGTAPCPKTTPNVPAFENEYAPFGVDSGLCMGVATTAVNGEGVTLQPCGVSANTVWILDTYDSWDACSPTAGTSR